MLSYIKKLLQQYSLPEKDKNTHQSENGNKEISSSLDETIRYFKSQFDKTADLTIRELEIKTTPAAIITIEGMINKEVLASSVINPIVRSKINIEDPVEKYEYIKDNLLSTSEQVQVFDFEQAFALVMSGFALIAIDGNPCVLAIGIQGFSFRGVSEPTAEVMQRGSREGFVEPLRINMTLIRRRMKNPKLKFETMKLGSMSKTDICLCYLRDMASPKILKEIKTRLAKVDLQTVMAAGYLTPYLEDERDHSFFNSTGISERPDTVCGKIAEGRICILVDGTPSVIIAPYLFVEYFQNMDDYLSRPYYATFIRWLKYFAFFLATMLPGIYVAAGTFNPELFPEELLTKIAKAIGTTPFPLMVEALVIHFIYEIMREAGLRLPKPLGHAVSIVGALVIGDTSIKAGLIGATTLMVLATTAISSYVIPNLYEPIAILRLIFILVGGTMGMWGVMLLLCIVALNICSKRSFGIPFLAPIAPFNLFGMRDVAIRASWKILSKHENPVQSVAKN